MKRRHHCGLTQWDDDWQLPEQARYHATTGFTPVERWLFQDMTMSQKPTYTKINCTAAYQLLWSLTVFFRHPTTPQTYFDALKKITEKDGIRILKEDRVTPQMTRFFISSKPFINPQQIIRSVKGRLQHLIREIHPKALKRNYSIISIGRVKGKIIENYVANQHAHHVMAEDSTQKKFAEFLITNKNVDLMQRQQSSHGQYIYNLHLVLVHESRWMNTNRRDLKIIHTLVPKICERRGFRLSQLSILADHLHCTLGCPMDISPGEVALSFLNNSAYALKLGPIYKYSFYVGTFGPYDHGILSRKCRDCGWVIDNQRYILSTIKETMACSPFGEQPWSPRDKPGWWPVSGCVQVVVSHGPTGTGPVVANCSEYSLTSPNHGRRHLTRSQKDKGAEHVTVEWYALWQHPRTSPPCDIGGQIFGWLNSENMVWS